MKPLEYEFKLTDQSIDAASETIGNYFAQVNIERKELMRLRLSVENVLLNWQTNLGKDTEVVLTCSRRFGDYNIIIQCQGEECNPLKSEGDDIGGWARSMQEALTTAPSFDYLHKKNTVRFVFKRKHFSRVLQSIICIILGIIIGLIGLLLSDDFKTAACDNLFTPLYETYLSVFGLAGVPLIFLSMVNGILGVGDIHSFSQIGKKMVLMFLGIILVTTTLAILVGLPFFSFQFGSAAGSLQSSDLIDMILGWLPTGLFQPFINSDAMQLIILGAAFGIGILVLNGCSGSLVNTLNDVQVLLLRFCRWLACLIPPFVCIMIVKSAWSGGVPELLSAWKSWVITTGAQLLFLAALVGWICLKYKAAVKTVLKKISRTFLVALGTNSCSVSISDNYAACGELGISPRVFSFGIPIGTSIFKPATAIRLVILSYFMANSYGLTISIGWLIILGILSIVLSIAIPAIPGGTLMFCSMLFAKLGIPTEVVTQMLATDVFFDCICTAVNQVSVTLGLGIYSGSVGLLDEEKMRKI